MDGDMALFLVIKKVPDNKVCLDCKAENPTWASIPHGAFICEDCAHNRHSKLGFEICTFGSENLQSWNSSQLRMMTFGGNYSAKSYLEGFRNLFNMTDATNLDVLYKSDLAKMYRDRLWRYVQKSFAEDRKTLKAYNHQKVENPGISLEIPYGATMADMIATFQSVMENGIQIRRSMSSMLQITETDEARRMFPKAKSISSVQFFEDQEKMNDTAAKPHFQNFAIKETDEARRKFPNAKSISSAYFFGDEEKMNDTEAKLRLQKFVNSNAISSADFFRCEITSHPPMHSGEDFVDRLCSQVSSQNSIVE